MMKNIIIRKATIAKLNSNSDITMGRTMTWSTRNGRTMTWSTRA
ncbi:MAG: hypothetical protein V4683_10360 [Bacteroidota bacterium]